MTNKNVFRKILSLLIMSTLVLSLSACQKSDQITTETTETTNTTNTDTKQEESSGTQVNPDDEIVLAGYRNIAPGIEDAYYCSVILYVWEPLVTMDENGEPVGKLAKSWDMSEDAKTWTFNLQRCNIP